MKQYNPKRIERTINRFEGDRETISETVQKNLTEMGELTQVIDVANNRIAALRSQNNNLKTEFEKIGGKIEGLKMVLEDTTDES